MTKSQMLSRAAVAALAVSAFVIGSAIAKPAAKLPVLSHLKDAAWNPVMKESPLPALAPIEGDPMKGPFMAYLKLPAGFESPPHSHGKDYWAVLVQGKMTHWAAAGGSEKDSKQLGVGDLTFMPGKTDHISKCYPGAECVMVVMQRGKFDFVPAKAPKGEAAKAAEPKPGDTKPAVMPVPAAK
jgi:hypothetical protein